MAFSKWARARSGLPPMAGGTRASITPRYRWALPCCQPSSRATTRCMMAFTRGSSAITVQSPALFSIQPAQALPSEYRNGTSSVPSSARRGASSAKGIACRSQRLACHWQAARRA